MTRLVLIVLTVLLPSAVHVEKRVALLIGNKDYKRGVGAREPAQGRSHCWLGAQGGLRRTSGHETDGGDQCRHLCACAWSKNGCFACVRRSAGAAVRSLLTRQTIEVIRHVQLVLEPALKTFPHL
jgi:hypothetical protein